MRDSDELRARLQAGIRELEDDIARCRAAIAALDRAQTAASPERRLRARVIASAADAQYEVVPAGKLVQLLDGEDGGLATSDLADRTHGDPAQVLQLLKDLEEDGKVRRTGNRRSTRWHASAEAEAEAEAEAGAGAGSPPAAAAEPAPQSAPEPEPAREPEPALGPEAAAPATDPPAAERERVPAAAESDAADQAAQAPADDDDADDAHAQDPETVSISALSEGTRTE